MYYDVNAEINHVKYLYNADGQRIYEIANGSLTGFLYDNGIVISEYDNGGLVSAQYIHGLGLGHDVGSLICKQTAEDTQYSFYNYRGDVIDTLIGATITSYRYDAFGNLIDSSAPEFGFSSKRYDASTSLSYFGARYYDSSLGRFISRDPMGYIDGPNGYIYVSNSPINLIDPFGLESYDVGNIKFIRHLNDHHPEYLHIKGLGNGRNYVNVNTGEMFEKIAGSSGKTSKGPLPAKYRKALGKIGIMTTVIAIVLDVSTGESFADSVVNQIDSPITGSLGVFGEGDEDRDGIADFKDTDSNYYNNRNTSNANVDSKFEYRLDKPTETLISVNAQVNTKRRTISK